MKCGEAYRRLPKRRCQKRNTCRPKRSAGTPAFHGSPFLSKNEAAGPVQDSGPVTSQAETANSVIIPVARCAM